MTFKLITDSTADLSSKYCEENDLTVLGMTIAVDGQSYETVGAQPLGTNELLQKMGKGAQATTSAIGSGEFQEIFAQLAAEGQEILYLAFSSGLSGTYQSAVIAREMVLESQPKAQITVLDTLAAASGEGYLVEEAVKLRDAGKSLTEVAEILTDLSKRLRSWFLVDDLNHLARGGRIPKATAVIGTLANIKPILDVDTQGHLRQVSKTRGSKKALSSLIAHSLEGMDPQYPRVLVAHSNAEVTAKELKDRFLEENSELEVVIRTLGPVIAAHTGAGTLAIFTIGKAFRQ